MSRIRLHELVRRLGLANNQRQARALILSGEIWAGDQRLDKAGGLVEDDLPLEHRPRRRRYASRGGQKLAGALTELQLDVSDMTCIDLGASTGGFTDCLLQRGARRVVAVDVGQGQLDWSLRNDDRVEVREGQNVRFLSPGDFPEAPDLIVADLSFISLRLIFPVIRLFAPAPTLVLVKPQFEARAADVEPGGVIHDPTLRQRVVDEIEAVARDAGFKVEGRVDSALAGRRGNREVFLWLGNPKR